MPLKRRALLVFAVTAAVLTGCAPNPSDVAAAKAYNSAHATIPAQKFVPQFLAIGDSFTGGSAQGGTNDSGWPILVRTAIGGDGHTVLQVNILARGGSGYVNVGPSKETLQQAVADKQYIDQDVIVAFGSINDSTQDPASVGEAAKVTYADLKSQSPNAVLIVVGPAWPKPTPAPANMVAVKEAVKAAAVAAGAQFIDPIADGWFTGDAQRLIGADGTHPTNAGHQYMADKLSPVIGAAISKVNAAHKVQ